MKRTAELSYSQAEISGLFKSKYAAYFSRHKTALIAAGFPPRLPGPGRPLWSKAQVDRWFITGGKTYLPVVNEPAVEWGDIINLRLDAISEKAA